MAWKIEITAKVGRKLLDFDEDAVKGMLNGLRDDLLSRPECGEVGKGAFSKFRFLRKGFRFDREYHGFCFWYSIDNEAETVTVLDVTISA